VSVRAVKRDRAYLRKLSRREYLATVQFDALLDRGYSPEKALIVVTQVHNVNAHFCLWLVS
jgi:hypothetical protein